MPKPHGKDSRVDLARDIPQSSARAYWPAVCLTEKPPDERLRSSMHWHLRRLPNPEEGKRWIEVRHSCGEEPDWFRDLQEKDTFLLYCDCCSDAAEISEPFLANFQVGPLSHFDEFWAFSQADPLTDPSGHVYEIDPAPRDPGPVVDLPQQDPGHVAGRRVKILSPEEWVSKYGRR